MVEKSRPSREIQNKSPRTAAPPTYRKDHVMTRYSPVFMSIVFQPPPGPAPNTPVKRVPEPLSGRAGVACYAQRGGPRTGTFAEDAALEAAGSVAGSRRPRCCRR